MDIVFVSHLFLTPEDSVNGVFVHRQAQALSDRGHRVRVVSPVPYVPGVVASVLDRPSSNSIPRTDTFGDITVHYPRYVSLPRAETLPLVSYSYRRALRKELPMFKSADLINAHVAVPDGFASAALARELDIPLVTTIHGADLQGSVHLPFVKPQFRRVVDSSTKLILNSEKIRGLFVDHFGSSYDFHVVHNGIPVDAIEDAPDSPSSDVPRLISVGHLVETKGHKDVINAIANLPVEVEYEIVGDGPLRESLAEQADSLGIGNWVIFTGSVSQEDVFRRLKAADLFVLPSYEEAFGIAYLEAMACGLPVIACEGEGPSDFITHGETGFLVPPQDTDALATTMQKLLESDDIVRYVADRGQRTALNGFSWERNAEAVESIFVDATT